MSTRIKNVKRNLTWGILNKTCTLLLPFLTRTVLIYTIGIEYVGLNSLFISLLGVLNLSELGVGTAMVYMMYKPMADGDDDKISALLGFCRKCYLGIGVALCALGAIALPCLPFLVHGDVPSDINIYVLFYIYLLNTALSYFMYAYKQSAFIASQRNDYLSNTGTVLAFFSAALQVAALILFRSYYLYVLVLPFITVIQNIIVALLFKKKFPQLSCKGKISSDDLNKFKANIFGLLTQKVGNVFLNSVDGVVISVFLGLVVLGVFNNYYIIMTALMGLMSVVASNLIPSIGNSMATESVEKNYKDFCKFDCVYTWIAAWMSSCFFVLSQPFVTLWIGYEYTLPMETVIFMSLMLYTSKMSDMTYIYRDAGGLWQEGKYVPLIAGVLNFILSIVLVGSIGLLGVVIATIVSMVFIYLPFYTRVLFVSYFQNSKAWYRYICWQILRIVVLLLIFLICYEICSLVNGGGWFDFALKLIVMIVLPNLLLWLVYHRASDYKAAFRFLLAAILRT